MTVTASPDVRLAALRASEADRAEATTTLGELLPPVPAGLLPRRGHELDLPVCGS